VVYLFDFELFILTCEHTSFYTLYATFFVSLFIQIFWLLDLYLPELESTAKELPLQLSQSDLDYIQKSDLSTSLHLTFLKKIRLKLSPDEELTSFSPNINSKILGGENEKSYLFFI